MIWWICWVEFWTCFLRVEPRHTARLYDLDDYRDKKPPRRAA
jgi:hypothetical protein